MYDVITTHILFIYLLLDVFVLRHTWHFPALLLFICLFVCLFCLFVCSHICLYYSACLSTYVSVNLSFFHLYICLSVSISVCIVVFLFVCLHSYLSMYIYFSLFVLTVCLCFGGSMAFFHYLQKKSHKIWQSIIRRMHILGYQWGIRQ